MSLEERIAEKALAVARDELSRRLGAPKRAPRRLDEWSTPELAYAAFGIMHPNMTHLRKMNHARLSTHPEFAADAETIAHWISLIEADTLA